MEVGRGEDGEIGAKDGDKKGRGRDRSKGWR